MHNNFGEKIGQFPTGEMIRSASPTERKPVYFQTTEVDLATFCFTTVA